jgi:hypothetical protein
VRLSADKVSGHSGHLKADVGVRVDDDVEGRSFEDDGVVVVVVVVVVDGVVSSTVFRIPDSEVFLAASSANLERDIGIY